jgi:hypothetical protein
LEAGAVVTLGETNGAFRSSLLRSPAGAYRRSQSKYSSDIAGCLNNCSVRR